MAVIAICALLPVSCACAQSGENPLRGLELPTTSPSYSNGSRNEQFADENVAPTTYSNYERVNELSISALDSKLQYAGEYETAKPGADSPSQLYKQMSAPKAAPDLERGLFQPIPKANTEQQAVAGKPGLGFENLELDGTVKKIILNTLLVLAVAVMFLYFARKTKAGNSLVAKRNKPEFGIEQTLPLGNKATLKLVRIGEHQVLIAMDSSGVKSVVSLHESFNGALEELEQQELAAAAPAIGKPSESADAALLSQLERMGPEFKNWLLSNQASRAA
ncbi:MAG: flagellar biosynthetic protein FliO [Pirellulaceae bacterium]